MRGLMKRMVTGQKEAILEETDNRYIHLPTIHSCHKLHYVLASTTAPRSLQNSSYYKMHELNCSRQNSNEHPGNFLCYYCADSFHKIMLFN